MWQSFNLHFKVAQLYYQLRCGVGLNASRLVWRCRSSKIKWTYYIEQRSHRAKRVLACFVCQVSFDLGTKNALLRAKRALCALRAKDITNKTYGALSMWRSVINVRSALGRSHGADSSWFWFVYWCFFCRLTCLMKILWSFSTWLVLNITKSRLGKKKM